MAVKLKKIHRKSPLDGAATVVKVSRAGEDNTGQQAK
jgi:hypothetical protein